MWEIVITRQELPVKFRHIYEYAAEEECYSYFCVFSSFKNQLIFLTF